MRLAFEDPALNDSFLFEYEFYFCSYLIFSECLVRAVIFFSSVFRDVKRKITRKWRSTAFALFTSRAVINARGTRYRAID